MFTLQTHWIAKNKDKYDIRYVLGLGDITDDNTRRQWRHAQEAIAELDGRVPYALAAGNHDYTPHGNPVSGRSGMNSYFPPSKFQKWPTFGGVMKPGDITNSYHLFSAGRPTGSSSSCNGPPATPPSSGPTRCLPSIRSARRFSSPMPTSTTTAPATILPRKANRRSATRTPIRQKDGNDGEELWQKLVRKNNFALVFYGHVCGRSRGFLASRNDRGRRVCQMVVDYQGRALGGEGYLRILEFLPDGKTVHVKSYSPLYDKYLDDADNQFSFELDP